MMNHGFVTSLLLILFFSECTEKVNALPPDWYLPLRDAVYEQNLVSDRIVPLYGEIKQRAERELRGALLYTTLSRCEYILGRAYQYEGLKSEAASCYERGISWAEKSLDESPSSEAWQMLAENISQSCAVRSVSYAMANGLNVEKYAKNALSLNPNNAAAQYMIAAKHVYAPAPFNNYRRGIQMMQEIVEKNDSGMEQDDRFNVYSAIGYAYIKQKKYPEARSWLEKSLSVYPTNKYVRDLLDQTA